MPYEQPAVPGGVGPSTAEAAPAVLSGELADDLVGESPPEHGWLGHCFIWGLYTLAPIQLFAGVYLLTAIWDSGAAVGMLPMLLFFPLLFVWVAHSVQTFKLQGWGVAMLMLLFAAFSTLRLLLGDPNGIQILAAFAMGALEIGWIRYFWNRRPDFT